jgi:signal transduction histidine kinase
MNLADTEKKSGSGSVVSNAVNARVGEHWLIPVRIVIVVVAVISLAVFVGGVLLNFAQFRTACTPLSCADGQLTPESAQALQALGFSLDAYAIMNVVFLVIQALVYYLIATIIFWRRSNEWLAVIVVLGFLAAPTNSLNQPLTAVPPVFPAALAWVQFLGIATLILIGFLFPNGRFVPRWTLPFAVVGLVSAGIQTFFPDVVWPPVLAGINWVIAFSLLVFSQIYRYRKVSSREQRQQTKWFVFGFTGAVMINLVYRLLPLIFPSFAQPGSLDIFFGDTLTAFSFLLIPLTIGFAILRYKLWDIDIIINRTLVYGTLTVSIVGLYVLVVVSLGTLLRGQGNLFISLLATGLIAVLFQPLRLFLQRAVNRLMFGERDNPYHVISHLGQRLGTTLAPEAVLPMIVETVTQALKLPYAAITLKQGDEFSIVASHGEVGEIALTLPLVYQAETIGQLLLAPRARGESFTSADRRLLDDLARQAGIAAHAVRLTTELQRARERLVTTREEERRRLRRDLHDGLGPTLAALNLQAGAVRTLIPLDPDEATALVTEWRSTLRSVIADIRRLVYDLRPPALDELGLIGAIREQATQYSTRAGTNGVQMLMEAPDHLPALPAAVEVAAYRIAQEALANVARHAQARTCRIHLWLDNALHLWITDDGIGLPEKHRSGVGLLSMRERAEELGGSCSIDSTESMGTRVSASLPFPKDFLADHPGEVRSLPSDDVKPGIESGVGGLNTEGGR